MRKKYHDNQKNYEDNIQQVPTWLQGEGVADYIRTHGQDRNPKSGQIRSESCDRSTSQYDPDTHRSRRLETDGERLDSTHTRNSGNNERRTKAILDEGTRNRRRITTSITFAALRKALSDDELRSLLDRTYNPLQIASIEPEIKSSTFAEDFYLQQPTTVKKIKRVKGTTTKKIIPPSKRYIEEIESFQRNEYKADAKTVLGYYFVLYFKYFHEEDPDWVGSSSSKAIDTINKLAIELTEGDYKKIINYVRKIVPLWVYRLKNNHEFPDRRPTINALFGGKRYFWANRNILYKKWQQEK